MTENQKIYGAIATAMKLFRQAGIGKDGTCSSGARFNYRSIDSTMAIASGILQDSSLAILPVKIDRNDEVITGSKVQILTRLTVTYRILCTEDGSCIDVQSVGDGIDFSDKAAGKAMSYAFKEMIFKTFCVPVQGQLDSDSEVIERNDERDMLFADEVMALESAVAEGRAAVKKAFDSFSQEAQAYLREKRLINKFFHQARE